MRGIFLPTLEADRRFSAKVSRADQVAGRGERAPDGSLLVEDAAFTNTDRALLQLDGAHYRHEANRVQAARDELGSGEVAFDVRVNAPVDDPAAELAEPAIVHRLRRLRDEQRRLRRASERPSTRGS